MKTVGVLALQGDFEAHRKAIEKAGARAIEIRTASQLEECDGLILPGGESTTILKLLEEENLIEPLRRFGAGKPIFGTCAGAILLAREVRSPAQPSLRLMDIRVERNAYGRQLDSSIREGCFMPEKPGKSPLEMVFIRAPKIERVGHGVEVIATEGNNNHPVAVRQGKVMATTFHPELSDDPRIHRSFLDLVRNGN